jgi:hypothetical protein
MVVPFPGTARYCRQLPAARRLPSDRVAPLGQNTAPVACSTACSIGALVRRMRPGALLHHDRDFATIASVTGQALRWYGPD